MLFIEIIFMNYSFVHRAINDEAFERPSRCMDRDTDEPERPRGRYATAMASDQKQLTSYERRYQTSCLKYESYYIV